MQQPFPLAFLGSKNALLPSIWAVNDGLGVATEPEAHIHRKLSSPAGGQRLYVHSVSVLVLAAQG
jgi:hypothetical protein